MTMRSSPLIFIILLGIVSLFADVNYEGARSIVGPYLSTLGASGTAVGVIVGIGELVGYGFRYISGLLSDKTKRYWAIAIFGYILNLFSVPLLAFAWNWQIAAVLVILERMGKAFRVPARDAMLSFATKQIGRGWGFGIHGALDKIGAVCGPLFIAALLYFHFSYRSSFLFLLIPACICMLVLFVAKYIFPKPEELEVQKLSLKTEGLPKYYWLYLLAVGLVAAGYADFALIAYHFQKSSVVSPIWIPLFYSVAMSVDGLSGLIMGKLYDIKGISILWIVTIISSLFAPLVFLGDFYTSLFGMVLWGLGMGSQETVMRAVVATLVPPNKRGAAYGLLNLVFGVFWAAGSAVIGYFYDISLTYLIVFSMASQLIAVPLFLFVKLQKE